MQAELTEWTRNNSYYSLSEENIGQQQKKVYDCILLHGNVTDEEIELFTGIKGSSVRPRRGELLKKGLIVPSYLKITSSGRMAVSWCSVKKVWSSD
jgi:transcription initiation factor IIE alpha subunit